MADRDDIERRRSHGFHDELEIPVIDNTANEADLADSLAEAITNYPKSNAVLVQRHGCYVWGPTWEKAKTQSECLHYLLEAAVKMDAVGFDPAETPRGGCLECGAGMTSSSGRQGGPTSNGINTSGGSECLQSPDKEEPRAGQGQGETAPAGGGTNASSGGGVGSEPYMAPVTQQPAGAAMNNGYGDGGSQGGCTSIQLPAAWATPPLPAVSGAVGPAVAAASSSSLVAAPPVATAAAGGDVDVNAAVPSTASAPTGPLLPAPNETAPGSVSLVGVKVLVLDIEGTTTPITFVKQTLFPYAQDHLARHLKDQWECEDLQRLVRELKMQAEKDAAVDGGTPGVPQVLDASSAGVEQAQASVAEYVRFVMSSDRKLGPMKSLQGHIWRQGYADGGIVGVVYADVEPAFRRWTQAGKRLAIYSSGSREAQRLLFGKSTAGDLRPYLSSYFDTSIGGKKDSASYREICLFLGVDSPSEVLFLTDLLAEAEAAKLAGVRAVLSVRPGNEPLPDRLDR
ncbi:haloacid dehalogenase-like hydrolase family protein [Ectocarpus siliculosus]|uniref:Haloacid dehalogenase-like hydrolase family protein n=1 Tax=Ectocarpus siliculosus TaxID=2880 RepID=D7FXI6_ECTSI|nr:haloacid dehalogenase-like hydrolase family protein [Ectocarpus siliculosus]|eukprot:CBJ26427.1 haloacid dehalogenase-like hydrolase family protein [Ectocarpus siliculosus]